MTEGQAIAPSGSDIKNINKPSDSNEEAQLENLREIYKRELIRKESLTHNGGEEFAEEFKKAGKMNLAELKKALREKGDWKNK